jgi:NAD(P)-dependent dehydrogenase (short-subunit alcohol dehydrogenase family)
MNTTPAIVTGVGPGTERSAVQRLTQGRYEMAMGATSEERLRQFEADIPGSRAFPADVTNASEFIDALDQISADFGAPEVVIYNAVGGVFGNFMQIDPAILELNFQIDVMTFLHLVRRLAPAMVEAGQGVIIASGNTSALRGKVISRVLPTKAAQRILAESIARELGPRGVHVAYVLIDAVIDLEWTRALRPNDPRDFFIQPAEIAEEIWHVVHRPKGAWSFNVEIRPFKEAWCSAMMPRTPGHACTAAQHRLALEGLQNSLPRRRIMERRRRTRNALD